MPSVLIFEDDYSRMVTCWGLECRPNRGETAELTVATLAAGYEGTDIDGVMVGGLPDVVRVDNAKAFLCEEMDALAATVGNEVHAVPPYSPFMKGKVERIGKTLQETCIALMQGYTHGAKTYTGRNPFRDAGPITEATLRAFLTDWFHAYNVSRVHSRLEHGTPLRQWASSPHPVQPVGPEKLRNFLFPLSRTYKAQKDGVWWDGGYWLGPGFTSIVGEQVSIRRPIHANPDRIEIFRNNGKWALTAWRAENLTKEQAQALYQERSQIYSDAIELVEGAAARRGDATAIAAEEGTPISPASAPDGDVFAADVNDLWDVIGNDPAAPTDEQTIADSQPKKSPKRAQRRPITSRRRLERPDPSPSEDLWELFDELDTDPEDNTSPEKTR